MEMSSENVCPIFRGEKNKRLTDVVAPMSWSLNFFGGGGARGFLGVDSVEEDPPGLGVALLREAFDGVTRFADSADEDKLPFGVAVLPDIRLEGVAAFFTTG